MKPEQQRIKLAKLDGWEYVPETERCPAHWWKNTDGCHISTHDNGYFTFYSSDLNAVHGLLLKLTEDQLWKCIEHLVGWRPAGPHGFPILSRSQSIKLAKATA